MTSRSAADCRRRWTELKEAQGAALKKFVRAQTEACRDRPIVFLCGDSIFEGRATAQALGVDAHDDLDLLLCPETGLSFLAEAHDEAWRAVFVGPSEFDSLDAFLRLYASHDRDWVVLQDSGPRPAGEDAFTPLLDGRMAHVAERGCRGLWLTSPTSAAAQARYDWSVVAFDGALSPNSLSRKLASSRGMAVLDMEALCRRLEADTSEIGLFLKDGVHLSLPGYLLLISGIFTAVASRTPDPSVLAHRLAPVWPAGPAAGGLNASRLPDFCSKICSILGSSG